MEQKVYRQMAAVEKRHWWFSARRTIVNHLLKKLSLSTPSHILEVGCGTGGNLTLLAQYGQVSAIELNEVARDLASQYHCAHVVSGALPDRIPFGKEQFELIVLLDVLEHLKEDSLSLQALLPLLKDQGWLLLTVPALPSLWSQHDEMHHHYRRYRKTQLRELVESAGYNIIMINYFNFWLLPLIFITRYMSRFTKKPYHDLTLPPLWLNKILEYLFASERYLIDKIPLPMGVSLLLIAQKKM